MKPPSTYESKMISLRHVDTLNVHLPKVNISWRKYTNDNDAKEGKKLQIEMFIEKMKRTNRLIFAG